MPSWLVVILALGGSSVIGYVVTQVCISIHHGTQKYKNYIKDQKQEELRVVFKEELKGITEKVDNIDHKLTLTVESDVTLLRDRMKSSLDECRKKRFATSADKANWNELYTSYCALGGNHFREYVSQWKAEIDSLPIERTREERHATRNT